MTKPNQELPINHVAEGLKQIRIRTLNAKLPIWLDSSFTLTQDQKGRLDNNYWSASYYDALKTLKALQEREVIEVKKLGEMRDTKITGLAPKKKKITDDEESGSDDPDGDVPLIEGSNIRPNVIYPLFEKFSSVEEDQTRGIIAENDIILTKDGMPAAYAYISRVLIDVLKREFGYERVAFSTHVYGIKLKPEYSKYAPYVVQMMNSKLGQALTRRFISGSVTPTIRHRDVDDILIPIPLQQKEKVFLKCKEQIESLQSHVMQIIQNVQPSNDLTRSLYKLAEMAEPAIVNLPVNWSGGGRRDLHGYYKD